MQMLTIIINNMEYLLEEVKLKNQIRDYYALFRSLTIDKTLGSGYTWSLGRVSSPRQIDINS